jgi:hypothetical protein
MCAFQSPAQGKPSFHDIENEFNAYFGSAWRSTTRVIGSSQFSMRFSNPKEVEHACFFGKFMKMKVFDAAINVAP